VRKFRFQGDAQLANAAPDFRRIDCGESEL
jgi:hypothetical protein